MNATACSEQRSFTNIQDSFLIHGSMAFSINKHFSRLLLTKNGTKYPSFFYQSLSLTTWPILGYLTIMSYICHRLELKQDEQSESAATCLCYRPRPATLADRPASSSHARLTRSVRLHYTEWVLLWRAGRDGARWLSFVWWPANRSFNQTHRIGATAALARGARAWLLLLAALHCCYSIASHLCMLFACLVTHYSILQGFY